MMSSEEANFKVRKRGFAVPRQSNALARGDWGLDWCLNFLERKLGLRVGRSARSPPKKSDCLPDLHEN